MTVDYAAARADANAGILEGGTTATLIQRGSPAGDAFNPTAGADTEYTITVLLMDYANRERDGTLIQADDRKMYVSAEGLTVTPGPNDKVRVLGDTYDLIRVMPFQPGGVTVFYEVQARK